MMGNASVFLRKGAASRAETAIASTRAPDCLAAPGGPAISGAYPHQATEQDDATSSDGGGGTSWCPKSGCNSWQIHITTVLRRKFVRTNYTPNMNRTMVSALSR
jgi:hypothetical protein